MVTSNYKTSQLSGVKCYMLSSLDIYIINVIQPMFIVPATVIRYTVMSVGSTLHAEEETHTYFFIIIRYILIKVFEVHFCSHFIEYSAFFNCISIKKCRNWTALLMKSVSNHRQI